MLENIVDDQVRTYAAQRFYQYMYEYIPAYTLALADTVDIDETGITFLMQYASDMYWMPILHPSWHYHRSAPAHTEHSSEYNFTPAEHPLASDEWDTQALNDHLDDLLDDVKRFIEARL